MKKLIVVITLIIFSNVINAYERNTHQYVVRQAYELVKSFYGTDIPILKQHIGNSEIGNGIFKPGNLLVIGAAREDIEDIIYGYEGIFQQYVTATHFWDPDRGDGSHFCTQPDITCFENAYQKAMKLIYGSPIIWSYTEANSNPYYFSCGAPGLIVGIKFRFNDIIDFYKTGYVQILAVRNSVGYYDYCSSPYTTYFSQELREKITWEILGRVCHLLADVSVPAHSHNDQHDPYFGGGYDSYEQYMESNSNYMQWSYSHGIAQGGLINVINKSNPIKYLFYSTAQVSNHFPSDHNPGNNTNGINDTFTNYTELSQMYSGFGDPPPGVNSQQIASSSYVFSMRAIAGLLYWFAKEANLLPIPLTGVYIFGNWELYAGQTGYWYAQPVNGIEPFTYNWEIMYLTEGSYQLSGVKGVPIGPRLPESGYWIPLGMHSETFSRLNNGSDLRNFKLRCTVTDGSNTTKISNEWTVLVYSTSPPQGNIVLNDNNNEVMMQAKENEVKSVPHEYSLDQNYPNPFNPTTRISYSLPEANFVTLKIYDMLGSEIATLVNEYKPAGTYIKTLHATSLPSGTYVYKLVAGNYQITKKMQLVK